MCLYMCHNLKSTIELFVHFFVRRVLLIPFACITGTCLEEIHPKMHKNYLITFFMTPLRLFNNNFIHVGFSFFAFSNFFFVSSLVVVYQPPYVCIFFTVFFSEFEDKNLQTRYKKAFRIHGLILFFVPACIMVFSFCAILIFFCHFSCFHSTSCPLHCFLFTQFYTFLLYGYHNHHQEYTPQKHYH